MENEKKKLDGGKIITTVIITVSTAIVFLALGYWAGTLQSEEAETATDTTALSSATTTASSVASTSASTTASATSTADWKTYTNTEYGFTLTFNSKWQGYAVKKASVVTGSRGGDASAMYEVLVPTAEKTWVNPWNPFVIYVYTPAVWENIKNLDGPKATLISQNSSYVVAYSTAQDSPPTDGEAIMLDVKNVISTFQFTSK